MSLGTRLYWPCCLQPLLKSIDCFSYRLFVFGGRQKAMEKHYAYSFSSQDNYLEEAKDSTLISPGRENVSRMEGVNA